MKLLYKIFAVVYRTFDDRGIDIPYFRSLVLVIFLFYVNIVSIGLLFELPSYYIMPWRSDEGKGVQWFKGALYFMTPIILFAAIFRKKKLDSIEVSDEQINRGRKILPIYILISLILLTVLLVRRGMNKGMISA
jgi:hypothetical protein